MDVINHENDEVIFLKELYNFLIKSEEFNSLEGKTQVLNIAIDNPKLGITTRKMHCMQVSKNAMKIATKMRLSDKDILLAQIIGLIHDIGHTPYGHDGEMELNRQIKKFGEEKSFKHEYYGVAVFEMLFDNLVSNYNNKNINFEKIKSIIKEGIEKHSQYYDYKTNENSAQRCARIADNISFIISDLSDLLKYKNKNGQSIITRESINKIFKQVKNQMPVEEINYVLDILENGGKDLEVLHDKVIEEIFLREENEATTIMDDYKLLQDIEDQYESEDTNLKEVFSKIITYYEYLIKYSNKAIPNQSFEREILGFLKEKDVEKALENLYYTKEQMDNNKLEKEEISKIEELCKNLKPNVVAKKYAIIESEVQQSPVLASLFAIQDTLQYRGILVKNKEALGNEKIDDKIEKKFIEILKIAYFAEKKQDKQLEFYNERKIPKIENYNLSSLAYTVFVIQQMQNKDFESNRTLEQVMQELNINTEQIDEIMKTPIAEIYEAEKQEKAYKINEIYKLTLDDAYVNKENISNLINKTIEISKPNNIKQNGNKYL